MAFDEAKFNWKQAIHEQGQRLVRVETLMENHLKHHDRWLGWKMVIVTSALGGCLAWIFRSYFLP